MAHLCGTFALLEWALRPYRIPEFVRVACYLGVSCESNNVVIHIHRCTLYIDLIELISYIHTLVQYVTTALFNALVLIQVGAPPGRLK